MEKKEEKKESKNRIEEKGVENMDISITEIQEVNLSCSILGEQHLLLPLKIFSSPDFFHEYLKKFILFDIPYTYKEHRDIGTFFLYTHYDSNLKIDLIIQTLMKKLTLHESVFLSAVILLERLFASKVYPSIWNSYTLHHLFIVAVLVSIKMIDDYSHSINAKISYYTNISLKNLNFMEAQFLELIRFNVFVSYETFEEFKKNLISKL